MSQNKRMLTLIELLRRGRERILRGWTQHAPARTATGTMCGASDPAATAWCAARAAWYADDSIPRLRERPLLPPVPQGPGRASPVASRVPSDEDHVGHLGRWNDVHYRTQADAVRLYDVTIARVAAAP